MKGRAFILVLTVLVISTEIILQTISKVKKVKKGDRSERE